MKDLFDENAKMITYLIKNNFTEHHHTFSRRLNDNVRTISGLIAKFYGEGNDIAANIASLYNIPLLLDVIIWKKNIEKLRKENYESVDKLINLLHSLTNWNLRDYFYNQITLIEAIAKSNHKHSIKEETHYYSKLIQNNLELSSAISSEIIKDNPKSFA